MHARNGDAEGEARLRFFVARSVHAASGRSCCLLRYMCECVVCDAMRVDQNTHGKYSHNHGFTYSAKQYFKFRPFFSSSSFSCLKVIAMRCDLFDFFRQVYL